MPTLKKGPKGGSYYISKKGKKVYSKAPPAKKDHDVKPKAKKDPLAGLDPALVAKVRSNPEAKVPKLSMLVEILSMETSKSYSWTEVPR